VKHEDLRPLSVIAGGESLVSHAGGVLLVETARCSGLAGVEADHDPGRRCRSGVGRDQRGAGGRTWKRTFGFHPLLAFADHGVGGNGEPLAELLRPGKPGPTPRSITWLATGRVD
jgi:hypothetical protein